MKETGFPKPDVTVDIVLMTIKDGALSVALFEREADPAIHEVALVGGYIHIQEGRDNTAEDAVRRILMEKTGLENIYFEQLKTFSGRERDGRGWSISIAYFALVPLQVLLENCTKPFILKPIDETSGLPFDHSEIIATARERLRSKGAYSTIAACLLPEHFTLPELLEIYQIVIDENIDQSAFRRKMMELKLLEEVGKSQPTAQSRRPSALWKLKSRPAVFMGRIKGEASKR